MKIIRPLLCLLFCTTFLLSAGEITLQSGDLSIHFSERGALLDIRRNGEGMLDNSPEAPAWSLYYKGGEITAAQYEQLPSVYNGGGETTFRWEQKGLPVVVCSVRPNDQQDGFAFSFAVENESKFRLDDFRFPHEFRLKIRKPEDYLLVVANNKHDTYLTPLQKLRRFEVMYPGFMAMQFAGFRINGDALLFYTDDTQSFVKHHSFSSKKGVLTYTVNHYIALEPDRFWEPDFSLIFRYIPGGDYNDMAHKYGEWARRQSWAKVKMEDKIAQRPVLDRILTDGLCRWDSLPCGKAFEQPEPGKPWNYVSDQQKNPAAKYAPYYDTALKMWARHEKLYGIRPGWWLPVWSGRKFDSHFPQYFPVADYMGDFEKFKAACEEQGWTFLPHMNTVHWGECYMNAEDRRRYEASWDGANYSNWVFAGIRQVILNLARSFEQELPTIKRISSPTPYAGLYLDVLAQGYAKDNSPGSPYRDSANGYQLGKLHQFRNIRKIISGPIMSEGRNELYLPYIDLTTGANGHSPDQIPVWEMVYGDCAVTNAFNTHFSPYYRKMWLVQGGVCSSYGPKWDNDQGQDLRIYTETVCQRVLRHVTGKLMRRHDRLGRVAVSQWDEGTVFINTPMEKETAPAENPELKTTMGHVKLHGLVMNGAFGWMQNGDFFADQLLKAEIDGKVVFESSSDQILVARGLGRWIIRNYSKAPVKVSFYSKCLEKETALPEGKWVRRNKAAVIPCRNGRVELEIPADELFVSGIMPL